MSYCRWSSDNCKCDVYVYESVHDCYTIHVASRRIVDEENIPPIIWDIEADQETRMKLFMDSHKEQMEWLKTAEREDIGLEFDGETFDLGTLEELLETLLMLKEVGYNVPDFAIEEVREELSEEANN